MIAVIIWALLYIAGCLLVMKVEMMKRKKRKKLNTVLWGYAEQKLSSGLYALFQYSINPTEKQGCRSYVGGGLVMRYKKIEGGVFADYAVFYN